MRYRSRWTRKRRSTSEVELNLAAMLDMAFQLLAFFILTFDPAPTEAQLSLHLPPPRPTTNIHTGQQVGDQVDNVDPVQGLNSLVITVLGNAVGEIDDLAIGDTAVPSLMMLESRLASLVGDKDLGFDQVIIQVGSTLRYQQLMQVIEMCTRQKLPNGETLSKLSFVEIPSGK